MVSVSVLGTRAFSFLFFGKIPYLCFGGRELIASIYPRMYVPVSVISTTNCYFLTVLGAMFEQDYGKVNSVLETLVRR